jgi:hypothetical protein
MTVVEFPTKTGPARPDPKPDPGRADIRRLEADVLGDVAEHLATAVSALPVASGWRWTFEKVRRELCDVSGELARERS